MILFASFIRENQVRDADGFNRNRCLSKELQDHRIFSITTEYWGKVYFVRFGISGYSNSFFADALNLNSLRRIQLVCAEAFEFSFFFTVVPRGNGDRRRIWACMCGGFELQ